MKHRFQFFVVLTLVVLAIPMEDALAQHDLSLYRKSIYSSGSVEHSFYPWYMYSGTIFIDARYNFDWEKTVGVFAGKSFGTDALSVVPTLGLLTGFGGDSYDGISPQVYLMGRGETYAFTLLNQYAFGVDGSPNYLYNWYEIFLTKPFAWLELGVTEQTYYEFSDGSKMQADIGPGTRVTVGLVYGKVWFATHTPEEGTRIYLTLGAAF